MHPEWRGPWRLEFATAWAVGLSALVPLLPFDGAGNSSAGPRPYRDMATVGSSVMAQVETEVSARGWDLAIALVPLSCLPSEET